MPDIFGRDGVGFGGAFTSAKAQMNITSTAGGEFDKVLITNLTGSYTQPITRVYEIASDKAYYVVGRPDGTGSFGSVVGPKAYAGAVYLSLADPCSSNDLTIMTQSAATCVTKGTYFNAGFTRTLQHVVLQSVGFSVNAQDMLINENVGFMFVAMYDGTGTT